MSLRPITLTLAILLSAAAGSAAAQTPPRDGAGPGMQGIPRTAEEVRPWAERLFTRLDADTDGAITQDELAVLDNPAGDGRGGARLGAMIQRADADGDARVSLEELVAGTQRMFARMN
ncbi:MAG: EF-hand domain-containing protein, partial [Brevundimonas sp.]|nr:EF-hand domain-containing protein [Brevundimonas sp.]